MYDPHGMSLSPTQEIQQIEQYYTALYSDDHQPQFNTEPITVAPFDCQALTEALRALPGTKALAPDGIPALVWKHFATDLAEPIMNTFVECWMGSRIQPPPHWTTGWIFLLPKPNKTPSKPQALRPICLQHPVSKVFAGLQCRLILSQAYPTLRQLPLYAYLPSRGTRDCLLIVASHCRQVRNTCSHFRSSPNAPGMQGGLQISLDMEKAFDTVARSLVLQALDQYQFDVDALRLIHSWLAPHKYCIPFKQLIGHVIASRGIKQGSKDAPLLWTLVMSAILLDLKARYSLAWLRDHVVVYADDVHLRWIIESTPHALEALTELQHVLDTFSAFGLKINMQKSFAIIRLVGREAPGFLRRWVHRKPDGPELILPEKLWRLPLVSKTAYLGVFLSYRAFDFDSTMRRITAAKWCFTQLRSWLTSTVHSLEIRLKLYRQCLMATVSYGIHEMGITRRGLARLVSMINTHHRIMTKSPVCLTHESTQNFFERLHLIPPWTQLQQQQHRIQQALHRRAIKLRLEAMTEDSPDICACIPDVWPSDLTMPVDTPDPQLTQELQCPECHRAFKQVGALKRHMRQAHTIPCEPDDLYNPLRDAWNGRPICSHCSHSFVDFYRLRDHIDRRVCTSFNPAQEMIIPIMARPDLKMHLRHKSIPGLLLNQVLIKELSCHCAFCHCQIAVRSIHKHYTDQHPQMVAHADQYAAHVVGLANIGSGRGRCSFCDKECRNVRSHECGVLFQLSAMLGYTFQPEHFPVMPVMMKASRSDPKPASSQSRSIPAVPSPHLSGDLHDSPAPSASCAPPSVCDAPMDEALTSLKQTIFVCQRCHSSFLTSTGLEKHMLSHDHDTGFATSEPARASKKPCVDTVQAMLTQAPADIPQPPKMFLCPLCQTHIGRKGLAGHLRNAHQVDKPEFFSFRPSRDMMHGRLGCAHCLSCFTTEAALKLHYQRATCPALLIEWVKDMHFGPADRTDHSTMTMSESDMPVLAHDQPETVIDQQVRASIAASPCTESSHCGLHLPLDTPAWHPTLTHDLCAHPMSSSYSVVVHTPIFGPEHRLSWYVHVTPWLAHFTAHPQVQIEHAVPLNLVHVCTRVHPIFWAWNSDDLAPFHPDRVQVHDNLFLQHQLFQTCLFELEHVLAQDWYHWCLHQGLRDGSFERRGSIFFRPDGGVFQSLQTATTQRGGTLIRSAAFPIRTAEVIALIGFGLGRRFHSAGYAGQTDLEARGPTEPIEPRSYFPFVHPGRQEFDPSADASDLEDMAWPTRARQGRSPAPSVDVSVGVRRTCKQSCPASTRVKRPRTDPGPSVQTDLDHHECMELSSVGPSGQDTEAVVPRSDLLRGCLKDDRTHTHACEPAGTDSSVHGIETDAFGPGGAHLQCGDSLETRHLPQEFGQPGTVRPTDQAHRQWSHTVDCSAATTLDITTITLGTSGPSKDEDFAVGDEPWQ